VASLSALAGRVHAVIADRQKFQNDVQEIKKQAQSRIAQLTDEKKSLIAKMQKLVGQYKESHERIKGLEQQVCFTFIMVKFIHLFSFRSLFFFGGGGHR
jgi:peptidoglycan hydrolase CwlO-like protein